MRLVVTQEFFDAVIRYYPGPGRMPRWLARCVFRVDDAEARRRARR
jgi:hypothetical protein